ncbi:MAG: hypothetical protein ACRET5_10345 [Steroidobacteraceae bacterium]
MFVRVRIRPRLIRRVDARCADCPMFGCFWLARHVVRSPVGSRSTEQWECGHREQRGCPEVPPPSDPPAYRQHGGAWEAIEGAVRQ